MRFFSSRCVRQSAHQGALHCHILRPCHKETTRADEKKERKKKKKHSQIENADEEKELYVTDFNNKNGYPEFEKIIPQQYGHYRSTKLAPPDLTELSSAREKIEKMTNKKISNS